MIGQIVFGIKPQMKISSCYSLSAKVWASKSFDATETQFLNISTRFSFCYCSLMDCRYIIFFFFLLSFHIEICCGEFLLMAEKYFQKRTLNNHRTIRTCKWLLVSVMREIDLLSSFFFTLCLLLFKCDKKCSILPPIPWYMLLQTDKNLTLS